LVDGIDLVESFLNRKRAHSAAINPDGKENGVHATFAHAGDVDVTRGIALAEVEIAGEEALGGVVVGVGDDGGEMKSVGLLGDGVSGSGNEQSNCAEKTDEQRDERADHQAPREMYERW
jgi:hypothetical protein